MYGDLAGKLLKGSEHENVTKGFNLSFSCI